MMKKNEVTPFRYHLHYNNNNPVVTRLGGIHRYYYYPAPLVLVVVVGLYVLLVDCNDPLHPWLWSSPFSQTTTRPSTPPTS